MIVTPTSHLSAGRIDQVQPYVEYNGKLVDTFDAYGQTVFLGPPLGLPAITLPVGFDCDRLPLGIQFQARSGQRQPAMQLSPRMAYAVVPDCKPDLNFGLWSQALCEQPCMSLLR